MTGHKPTAFGELLRRNRLAAGLSQEALAGLAGMSARGIADLERGARRWPYPATVRRLAEALGLSKEDWAALQAAVPTTSPVKVEPTQPDGFGVPGAMPHNLPLQRSRLFGRADDLAIVRTLLLAAAGRAVTLSGAGGCGKTRLALAVAADVIDVFADGVWLVELASLAEPRLIPKSVANAVGVREEPARPILDTLLTRLKSRQILLVLDNCEHLLAACATFADQLLSSCPGVHLLATSREPLRIKDEITWRVPSLAVPDLQRALPLEEVARSPAVQLFVERARAVQPNFALTGHNAPIVGEVCRRLDGLPLAIELAAGGLRALGIEQVLERLDTSVRSLVGGSRTAPARQQTMRATLDWSHALLTPAEQVVFRQLAVFAGGWSLEAAEAVCVADQSGGADILESLSRLVDKSLVVMEERNGRARYTVLEPIRQYALERLLQAEEAVEARRRHLAWYLELAEQSEDLLGTTQQPGLAQLQAEHDNLRAALAWSIENDPQHAVRLAGCLAELWLHGGHPAEGRRWLNAVLAIADTVSSNVGSRARLLLAVGRLAGHAGEFGAEQVALAQESVQLFRHAADQGGLSVALLHLGRCALEAGGPAEQIRQAFDESLRIAQLLDDQRGVGAAYANLAYLEWWQGRRHEALELYEQAVAHTRASGNAMFTGLFLGTLGWYEFAEGHLDAARAHKEEGLAILRSLGANEAVGLALLGLAHVARKDGDDARLLELLEESAAILRDTASPGLVDWLSFVGRVQVQRGEVAVGVRLLAAGDSEGPRFGSQRALFYLLPRDELGASLTAANSALGDAAFRTAWAEGKSMTTDQAVATALPQLEIIRTARLRGRRDSGSMSLLTTRQEEVAVLVAEGLTNRQIAERLVITPRAAAAHVEHILDKLGAGSRTQIGVWIAEHGLLTNRSA